METLKTLLVEKPEPIDDGRVSVSVYWKHRSLLVAATEILRVSNPGVPLAMPDVVGRVIELGLEELKKEFERSLDA